MNKKSLALIIVLIAIAGIYGIFYAAVTTVLMPQDLNNYKNELNSMPQDSIKNADIVEMENAAAAMESSSGLKYMSQSQRTSIANDMKNSNALPSDVLNSDWNAYSNFNSYKALAYSMVFKGELSNKIKDLSNNYKEISDISMNMTSQTQKAAEDLEKGDNKAYTSDLRKTADFMKQYNAKIEVLRTNLQSIVNELSK